MNLGRTARHAVVAVVALGLVAGACSSSNGDDAPRAAASGIAGEASAGQLKAWVLSRFA